MPTPEPEMAVEPEQKRASRMRQLSSQAAKHVAGKAAKTGRDIYYQTTMEERVILLASVVAIILSFFPWAVSTAGGSIVEVSGVASFLYLMGILVILAAGIALWSVVWILMEKPLPRFIDNPAKLHILLGIEITQIGLIAYTMLQASFTLTADLEAKTYTLIGLIVCGLAMMGAGIFEQNKLRKRNSSVIMPIEHEHHHDHEQSDREIESILGGDSNE